MNGRGGELSSAGGGGGAGSVSERRCCSCCWVGSIDSFSLLLLRPMSGSKGGESLSSSSDEDA